MQQTYVPIITVEACSEVLFISNGKLWLKRAAPPTLPKRERVYIIIRTFTVVSHKCYGTDYSLHGESTSNVSAMAVYIQYRLN